MTLIRLSGVTKTFPPPSKDASPVTAVDDVTLEVAAGEVCGIVGYSGAGKSTVLRLVNALETPTAGTVEIDGRDITHLRERELRELRGDIGMIFQQFNLFDSRTVAKNVAHPLEVARRPRAEIAARVDELLRFVGLADKARSYPEQLSGGQKQRVGIARALALQPKLLIADEPTSALDVSVQATVLQLLRVLQQDLGFACLFISHDLAVVDSLADRIIVMHHGHIVEQGATGQILRAPKEDYTRRLIAAIPVPDPDEQRVRREARAALLEAGLEG